MCVLSLFLVHSCLLFFSFCACVGGSDNQSNGVICVEWSGGVGRVPRHPSHCSLLPPRGRRLSSSGLCRRPRHRRAPLSSGDSVGFGVLSHTALLVPVPGLFSHAIFPIHPGPGLSPPPIASGHLGSLLRSWLIAYVLRPACPAHTALLVSFPPAAHCVCISPFRLRVGCGGWETRCDAM